ncbi:MAG: hypothetical protein ACLP9L_38635 [Thermoguttaceae bacterium]
MSNSKDTPQAEKRSLASTHPPAVPPGAPSWVTPDLIADTIRVFQPKCPVPLTTEDALEMILNAGQLLDVLFERRQ